MLPSSPREKMLRALIVLALWPLAVGSGTEPDAEPELFSETVFRRHIEYLASEELAGRAGKGGEKAAEFIRKHFETHRLEPLFGESYFQKVPGSSVNGNEVQPPGLNVGAILVGSDETLRDEIILIAAHYDHLGRGQTGYFPGADDNASGTSMLLEVSRALSRAKIRPKRSIAFVAFDQEERMLWGSRWFVGHAPRPLEQFKCVLVADMIGRSLGDLNLDTIFVLGSEHSPELTAALDAVKVPEGLHAARLGIDLIGVRSDYGPFWNEDIPFLFFSSGEHPDYHRQTDLPDKIDYPQVAKVSRLVHALTIELGDAEVAPTWQHDVLPSLEEVRTLARIVDLLLTQERAAPLTGSQLLLLNHVKGRTRQILERGTMDAGERSWLMRVSQLMIFSVL